MYTMLLKKLNSSDVVCVLSTPPKELIKSIKDNKILGVNQNNPCGTADAVKSALKKIPDKPNNKILILFR